jgi:ribose transport system substrate-binding protein
VALAALAMLVVAGCGGGSSNSKETGGSVVSSAEKAVSKAEEVPSAWAGPSGSPPALKAKKVAILSCSQASNCSVDAAAAVTAAKAIGWSATVFDGKGAPATYNSALHSAVDSGYDGIIDVAVPPSLAQEGLRYAKAHNVPVINAAEVQSTDPLIAGSVPHQWAKQGTMLGQWLVADSDGKAGVVIFRDNEFPGIKTRQDEVAKVLNACSGCKVLDEIPLTIAQDTNPSTMAQQTQSIIARYGDELTYIASPFGTVDGLIVPPLKAAGRSDVKVVGYDGNEQESALCHEGSVGAIAVTLLEWNSWGAIDQLNRVMQDAKPVDENVPAFLATGKTCPADAAAETLVTFDFQKEYEKLWSEGSE